MSIGGNIKRLRELKNLTQTYMAECLEMSQSGYGKIERDETDISISKLKNIAKILEIDLNKILNFDEKQIFNIYNNQNAAGVVSNQQINNMDTDIFTSLKMEIQLLREEIANAKTL